MEKSMTTLKFVFSARKYPLLLTKSKLGWWLWKKQSCFNCEMHVTELSAWEKQDQREESWKRWLWHTFGSKRHYPVLCQGIKLSKIVMRERIVLIIYIYLVFVLSPHLPYKSSTFYPIDLFILISLTLNTSWENAPFWIFLPP